MSGWSQNAIDTGRSPLRIGLGGLGQFQNPLRRERAHRQVVVSRPAEAAQVGAAAHDFDEEAGAELGVGREDRRSPAGPRPRSS